jgi:ABC-type transporter Mla subunit MlaD
LQAAIKQIEKDTESLVGVTSSQVNELFQITLQNAAALNNQSKQFPDAISAATSLTKGWAAALNVAGVPLNQARQEINSILKGQVDQNSVLAKSLNITNDQVRQWQAQGRLVDELNKKLEPYVAGNALAARSIAGIGSNIQDVIERLGRTSGEPLLEPIINLLDQVYNKLQNDRRAGNSVGRTVWG